MTVPWASGRQAARHAWADENAAGADELTSVRPVGMTSLRFIGLALRRRGWLACAVVLAGLAVTAVLFAAAPPAYQAQTSILVSNDPNADPNVQMGGNVNLAQSAKVAAGALRRLGLAEAPASFMRTYSVTSATDRILVVTASAPSYATAVRHARALAAAFLQFRASAVRIQQKVGVAALRSQIADREQSVALLQAQIDGMGPSENRHDVKKELASQFQAVGALIFDLDYFPVTTASMIKGTSVLEPAAPIPPSRKHLAAIFGAAGLVASLATGLAVVIVGALTSDRLRRRDEVARALGAPVKLSVGKLRRPWPMARRPGSTAGGAHQRRIVAHLRDAVADGGAALAVVPIDNAQAVAPSVASLAVECAREGRRVVLADLSAGAPAARVLGASGPGIHEISAAGTSLTVAIPDYHDVVPIGPVRPRVPSRQHRQPDKALAAACAAADLLLSTVTLDSSLGGDHLATWSTDVVVIVTAGRSVAAKIRATGDMIKLAGTRPGSAILLGADRSDESLGTASPAPGWQRPVRV